MSDFVMPELAGPRLITAVLSKGAALDMIRRLKEEKGIVTASMSFARGTGKMMPLLSGIGMIEREKEVLSVVVEEARCDEIFKYLYDAAGIGEPHGGIMYMHPLVQSSVYRLPDISEED